MRTTIATAITVFSTRVTFTALIRVTTILILMRSNSLCGDLRLTINTSTAARNRGVGGKTDTFCKQTECSGGATEVP
jgi:hypothetical protein